MGREGASRRLPRQGASENTVGVLTGLSVALATKTALRSGAVAFVFFFLAAMGLVAILQVVM